MDLVSIQESPTLFPHKNGRPIPVSSIRYWIITGSRGIYLKATKIGRTWFTSREWVEEFNRACTDRSAPQQTEHLSRRAMSRRMQAARDAMKSRFGVQLGKEETDRKAGREGEAGKARRMGKRKTAGVNSG